MSTQSEEDLKKAELRKKIEYQVACEERAHRIVERLIDNPVTPEALCNSLQYVTQSHYSDIVEERAVSKLCGYPICPNDLGKVPRQKYMISTKTNKVYDLEARKNFCCGKCFKASKHLEEQISNSPLWSRRSLPPIKFDLMALDVNKGKVGDEVIVSKAVEVKEDIDKLEKLDRYHESLEKMKAELFETGKLTRIKNIGSRTEESELYKQMQELDIGESASGDNGKQIDERLTGKTGNSKNVSNAEQDVNFEANGKQKLTGTDNVSKKRNKHSNKKAEMSKTDYLMQLLDKRKALLSKMVDAQENVEKSADIKNSSESCSSTDLAENESIDPTNDVGRFKKSAKDNDNVDDDQDKFFDFGNKCVKVVKEFEGAKHDINVISVIEKTADKGNVETKPKKIIEDVSDMAIESIDDSIEKEKIEADKDKASKSKSQSSAPSMTKASTVELICAGVKCWITKETAEYLKENEDSENDAVSLGKPEFEKQYKALVAKVDAQEKDFDALLGEESMEDDIKGQAPLPHFDVLKQEMLDNQKRVQEFMKGSFVYKITEKQVNLKGDGKDSGVILPTVDRYDQLVIRQKILLERVSKVLPDVLSPLHLLVQEVFTELRELICTFNLTSENIIYRPAEWTIITIILLRMLVKKLPIVQERFSQPGAVKYFRTILSAINSSLAQIDANVAAMFVDGVNGK